MSKMNPILRFCLLLTITLGIAFTLHTILLGKAGLPLFADLIVLAYTVNGLLAAIIFGLLYFYRLRLKNYIGFLFMVGSFLKFVFFFLLFYPAYKADGDLSKLEFAAFFVPYVLSLLLETLFTAKMLQKLD